MLLCDWLQLSCTRPPHAHHRRQMVLAQHEKRETRVVTAARRAETEGKLLR